MTLEELKEDVMEQLEANTMGDHNIITYVEVKLPDFQSVTEKISYLNQVTADLQITRKYNILSTTFKDGYAILEVKKGE